MATARPIEKQRAVQGLTFSENVSFFIRAVYQSKYLILLFVCVVAYGVYHYYSQQAPVYQATAKLFIGREQGQSPGITPFAEKSAETGFGDVKTHQAMMATRLVSEMVMDKLK